MLQRIEQLSEKRTWLFSTGVSAILLLLIQLIALPLFNSGDDAFLAYTMGGGFGEPGSNLMQYNHLWHYWLGWIGKIISSVFPAVNGYSLVLLLLHLFGASAVLYVFLKMYKTAQAFFFYLIFFIFFETRLLLSLNLTGTAFMAATGAGILLVYQFAQQRVRSRNMYWAFFLFILAGMLRLHVMIMAGLLTGVAAIMLLKRKRLIEWSVLATCAGILVMGLFKLHEHHYRKHIPGWQQQETFRQGLFYAYNRPLKHTSTIDAFTDSTEQQLYYAGFFYDSVKFSAERVSGISRNIVRKRLLDDPEDRQGLYWFFMELRIYLLLFALVIAGQLFQKNYRQLIRWLLSVLAIIFLYGYLFVFLKITAPVHIGLLMTLWIHWVVYGDRVKTLFPEKKLALVCFAAGFTALFAWMGMRLAKEDAQNRANHQRFLCATSEINKYKDRIYVATSDVFPLDYMGVWNLPKNYPVENLLYKDRLLTGMYKQTLKKYNIANLHEALQTDPRIFLLGPPLPALGLHPSERLQDYPCLEIRKANDK